jgi:hypothetical protein
MADRRGLTSGTYYARDAQGNVIGVYETFLNAEDNTRAFNLTEHHIYGSSRIGVQEYGKTDNISYFSRLVGDKRYELTNHLGNVLSVINDKKIVSSRIRHLFTDFFDKDEGGWKVFSESGKEYVTNDGRLKTDFQLDKNFGIRKDIEMDKEKTYVFQFKIDITNCSPMVPIEFRIRNSSGTLVSSAIISDTGIFTHSYETNDTVDKYSLEIVSFGEAAGYVGKEEGSLTIDDFYAYAEERPINDFVTLFLPDVVSYSDYYPFGSLVPNRHRSSDDYRYGFQGQEKDDEIKRGRKFLELYF